MSREGNDTGPQSLGLKSGVKTEPRVRDGVKVKDGARDGVKKREGLRDGARMRGGSVGGPSVAGIPAPASPPQKVGSINTWEGQKHCAIKIAELK